MKDAANQVFLIKSLHNFRCDHHQHHCRQTTSIMMLPVVLLLSCLLTSLAFCPPSTTCTRRCSHSVSHAASQSTWHVASNRMDGVSISSSRATSSRLAMTSDAADLDPNEAIARRIVVTGDVCGGYYRSCVTNEVTSTTHVAFRRVVAKRFRNLKGTMSPPDESRRAEIYVEGKRKSVESFIRWCRRGDVGLSQSIKVEQVVEEFPTGIYDDFNVDTGRG
ncbi:hypothetical protein HJC23_005762 [Cyclotella cryptica]|uniref:Acylphosphatase-like domain-containing protein n=1 Tax=Cyclotella cryptica TaxID=29204 RepID=A0ABD3NGS4_9STRA